MELLYIYLFFVFINLGRLFKVNRKIENTEEKIIGYILCFSAFVMTLVVLMDEVDRGEEFENLYVNIINN